MSLPIFFLPESIADNIFTLGDDASRHIVQVLRMHSGEQIQLTDGKGNLLTAEIIDPHKRKCSVKVINRSFQAEKEKRVCVAISLLKNASRFEWFLEKATEIGVAEIIPIICKRTEKQHFRYERMQQIVVAAMMQSQQVWLPKLHLPTAFDEVIKTQAFSEKLIAHCEDEQKHIVTSVNADQSIQILIGPEGDFTAGEIEVALQQSYKPVTLGATRLRTETAGVVAATLLCISTVSPPLFQ
jgi:16S rRNA (uracil1498-N3)-methyltransferase